MENDSVLLWQVFALDRMFLDIFSQLAEEDGLPAESVIRGSLDEAYRIVEKSRPRVLFLEENTDLPASAYANLGLLCKDLNIGFVLVGKDPRVITFEPKQTFSGLNFRQMAAFGIQEYLSLPLTCEDIRLCLGVVMSESDEISEARVKVPTKTILFAGVQGGVGASSLCANYSAVLSDLTKKNCLILDFDWSCSNLWMNFGIEPVHAFAELLADYSRIDGALIESSVRKLQDNLFLLSDCTSKVINNIDSLALDTLLKGIDGRFDYVLVDCPVYQQELVLPLLSYANKVFLVSDFTQASLSMLKRLLSNNNFEHMYGSLHLALNNREPESAYTLEDEDFTMCYNFQDHIILPYCKSSMQDAMLEGQVLAEFDDTHKYIKVLSAYIKRNEFQKPKNIFSKIFQIIRGDDG